MALKAPRDKFTIGHSGYQHEQVEFKIEYTKVPATYSSETGEVVSPERMWYSVTAVAKFEGIGSETNYFSLDFIEDESDDALRQRVLEKATVEFRIEHVKQTEIAERANIAAAKLKVIATRLENLEIIKGNK